MATDIEDIENSYKQAVNAYNERKFILAANLFKQCSQLYQHAEFNVFYPHIKKMGEDAANRYRELAARFLDLRGFDE